MLGRTGRTASGDDRAAKLSAPWRTEKRNDGADAGHRAQRAEIPLLASRHAGNGPACSGGSRDRRLDAFDAEAIASMPRCSKRATRIYTTGSPAGKSARPAFCVRSLRRSRSSIAASHRERSSLCHSCARPAPGRRRARRRRCAADRTPGGARAGRRAACRARRPAHGAHGRDAGLLGAGPDGDRVPGLGLPAVRPRLAAPRHPGAAHRRPEPAQRDGGGRAHRWWW